MKDGKLYQKDDIWYISYDDKKTIEVSKCCENPYDGKCVKFNIEDVYVEPSGNIHPNRGGYKKMAKLVAQIDKIELGESCLGPYVTIDSVDLYEHEHSTPEECESINLAKTKLLKELELLLPKMDAYDFRILAEVVVKRGEWNAGDNYSSDCEQCGNYNWGETYKR